MTTVTNTWTETTTGLRIYFKEQGGHTHVRMFGGPIGSWSYGKCGDLTFRNEEWAEFRATLERGQLTGYIEFIDEGADGGRQGGV